MYHTCILVYIITVCFLAGSQQRCTSQPLLAYLNFFCYLFLIIKKLIAYILQQKNEKVNKYMELEDVFMMFSNGYLDYLVDLVFGVLIIPSSLVMQTF